MPEYDLSGEQRTLDELTPAEVFDREGDTVAVSTTRSRALDADQSRRGFGEGSYGESGFGGQTPRRTARRIEVKHPHRVVPVGEDTDIVATAFNRRRDAWEVVVSTPR